MNRVSLALKFLLWRVIFPALVVSAIPMISAAQRDGATIYQLQCATCHDNSAQTRAPAPSVLGAMLPENIVLALESGTMKAQGASLTADEKRTVAEFLTGKKIGAPASVPKTMMCADTKAAFLPSDKDWNGWGTDLANTRFQSADRAGLSAAQVPKLKLKWAFAFPNTLVANGQPTVVGGRIFVTSANRQYIRSMRGPDANTGHSRPTHRRGPRLPLRRCRAPRNDTRLFLEMDAATRMRLMPPPANSYGRCISIRISVKNCRRARVLRRPVVCAAGRLRGGTGDESKVPVCRHAEVLRRSTPPPAVRSGRPTPLPKSPNRRGKIRKERSCGARPARASGRHRQLTRSAGSFTPARATISRTPARTPATQFLRSTWTPEKFSGTVNSRRTTFTTWRATDRMARVARRKWDLMPISGHRRFWSRCRRGNECCWSARSQG